MGKYEILTGWWFWECFFLSGLIRAWICLKRTFKYTDTVLKPVNLLYTGYGLANLKLYCIYNKTEQISIYYLDTDSQISHSHRKELYIKRERRSEWSQQEWMGIRGISMTAEILIQVGKHKNKYKCAYIHVLIGMYFLALYTERA